MNKIDTRLKPIFWSSNFRRKKKPPLSLNFWIKWLFRTRFLKRKTVVKIEVKIDVLRSTARKSSCQCVEKIEGSTRQIAPKRRDFKISNEVIVRWLEGMKFCFDFKLENKVLCCWSRHFNPVTNDGYKIWTKMTGVEWRHVTIPDTRMK